MAIQIKHVLESLKGYPEDWYVVLSKDEEGNGFHHLAAISTALVDPAQYDVYPDEEYPEDANSVILWP